MTGPKRVAAPKQRRSQRTLEAILEVAEELVDGRDFAAISVQEITERAGVSVSSFYARFPDKRVLLHAVFDRIADRARVALEERSRPERWEGRTLRDLAHEAIQMYMDFWVTHGGIIQTVKLAEIDDIELRSRHRRLERDIGAAIRRVGAIVAPELPWHSIDDDTVPRVLGMMAASVRSSVERPDAFTQQVQLERDRFVDALADVAVTAIDPAQAPARARSMV